MYFYVISSQLSGNHLIVFGFRIPTYSTLQYVAATEYFSDFKFQRGLLISDGTQVQKSHSSLFKLLQIITHQITRCCTV